MALLKWMAGLAELFVVVVALAQTSTAQQATSQQELQWPACKDTAMTQMAMNACAALYEQSADARMKKSYDAVACHFGPDDKSRLADAQQAWSAFRDADCRLWSNRDAVPKGSISPMVEYTCRAMLAEARADELDRWPFYGPSRVPCP
jgi:uncharacterized protein YecT (DUF1311 family)